MILTGETEVLGEKPVPVPLCTPHIPHGPTGGRSRSSVMFRVLESVQSLLENTPVGVELSATWRIFIFEVLRVTCTDSEYFGTRCNYMKRKVW
jgi:hypothetical protein